MGFKLPGKSIHTGTNAHRSALKMREHQIATSFKPSPAKETNWAAIHEKAKKKDPRYGKLSLEEYTTEAKRQMANYKKTGKWDAMGVYDKEGNRIKKQETPKTTKPTIEDKGEKKITKIQSKADKKIGEVKENVERKVTRKDVRKARKKYGRGSQEVKEAKVKREQGRLTDLEGGKGGKKAKFLGNVRRKLSAKRLAKRKEEASPTKQIDEKGKKAIAKTTKKAAAEGIAEGTSEIAKKAMVTGAMIGGATNVAEGVRPKYKKATAKEMKKVTAEGANEASQAITKNQIRKVDKTEKVLESWKKRHPAPAKPYRNKK
jgi:hypothetical protein